MKYLFGLTAICLSFMVSAGNITISKTKKGPNGYDEVKERHTDGGDHSLHCSNPGTCRCVWDYTPTLDGLVSDEDLELIGSAVYQSIENGTSTGKMRWGGKLWIIWNGELERICYTISDEPLW